MGQQSQFSDPVCEHCSAPLALWLALDDGEAACVFCGAIYDLDSPAQVSSDQGTLLDEVCNAVVRELGLQHPTRPKLGESVGGQAAASEVSRRERCLDKRLRRRGPKIGALKATQRQVHDLVIDLPIELRVSLRLN